MTSNNWHNLLFQILVNNENATGAEGKYVCLTREGTQFISHQRKENVISASAMIIYDPEFDLNRHFEGAYIHIREDFLNDAEGDRKHLGKRYHKDVYDCFDNIADSLELVQSKYPKGTKDPYANWFLYVVKGDN